MLALNFIKTYLFRIIACALLAVSVGFVILPESNVYSVDKTFIKAHAAATDNFALVLTADDKEDIDEDGSIDIQLSTDFSAGVFSFISFDFCNKPKVTPLARIKTSQVYIFHRQLLI